MSDRIMNSRRTRRRLALSEKYKIFVSVLTGQATQREAAGKAIARARPAWPGRAWLGRLAWCTGRLTGFGTPAMLAN